MPYYKTKDLETQVLEIEERNERILAVIRERDGFTSIVTELRTDDTGNPWLPSWAKGA